MIEASNDNKKTNKERALGLSSINQNLIGIMRFKNFKQLNQLKNKWDVIF